MSASELYDQGAQPERTLLAWGRTCLASSVLLALVIKVAAATATPGWIVLAVLGLALPVIAWALAVVRYRRVHALLTRPGGPSTIPGGGAAMAFAATATVVAGVVALVFVLA